MKRLIYILPVAILLFYSCNSGEKTAVDKEGNTVSSKFVKNVDLPENPCVFITKEMVTSNYDVKADKLELDDNSSGEYSKYDDCSYSWKKKNYEELQNKRLDIMMNANTATRKKGVKETSMGDLMKMEPSSNRVGVGHFVKYDNLQDALNQFTNLHHVPTKEEMEKLHKEMKKEADKKGLSEDSKKTGKKLTTGIGSNLKFTKVDGIGDQAFYSHLDRSLDVRFGTISFSILISTEEGLDKDIDVAKKLAKEVWNQL